MRYMSDPQWDPAVIEALATLGGGRNLDGQRMLEIASVRHEWQRCLGDCFESGRFELHDAHVLACNTLIDRPRVQLVTQGLLDDYGLQVNSLLSAFERHGPIIVPHRPTFVLYICDECVDLLGPLGEARLPKGTELRKG